MDDSSRADRGADSPQGPAFDAAGAQAGPPDAYRVLARKYRPSRFEDLIGQEAMVRTISNAFDLDRIHQAYILTGVRGVGKTTTARILARAFNYELPAAEGRPAVSRPTIHMPEQGVHCQAIIDSRHIDVVEMDAASHTGIDDVREIIESARYRPVLARNKVFIIDEVHMLSKQAFNGLLKTLEEPPDHVKFLFATTEIEKVPVTVRSRCQRFDLRRIEPGLLARHLAAICDKEGVAADAKGLAMIARAAEGSVRDALSLLDQAIAHAAGAASIAAEDVRAMLGLADRGRIIDLFGDLMAGRITEALAGLKELYDCGADPAEVLVELAEFVHLVTRLKLIPEAAADAFIPSDECARGKDFAEALSIPALTRAWQLLSKGLREVREAARPLAAADMVLVRLAFAADLPTPDEALRQLAAQGAGAPQASAREASPPQALPQPQASIHASPGDARDRLAAVRRPDEAAQREDAAPLVRLETFEDLVALAGQKRDIQLKLALERDVRLVRFEAGAIEFSQNSGASPQLAQNLTRKLQEWTGQRWMVAVSREEGAPSLKEREEARSREAMVGVRAEPLVRRVLDYFPGAEIIGVRASAPETRMDSPDAAEDEIGFADDSGADHDLWRGE